VLTFFPVSIDEKYHKEVTVQGRDITESTQKPGKCELVYLVMFL